MKSWNLFAVLLFVCAIFGFLAQSEAGLCTCDLKNKGQEVCGSNGVTFVNRCEFECTQRELKKLGRTLNIQKAGKC